MEHRPDVAELVCEERKNEMQKHYVSFTDTMDESYKIWQEAALTASKQKREAQREIDLQAMLANFQKGDRLRISISGSSWPAIGINPGDNLNLPEGASPHCLVTTIIFLLSNSKLEFKSLISS